MPAAIAITNTDHTQEESRELARKCKDANQSRRLPAGVGTRTLRDWILRYDGEGPSGLRIRPGQGRPSSLGRGQLSTLKGWLEAGPLKGLAGWRLSRLKAMIADVSCVSLSLEGIRRLIRRMGFRRLSPRPIHPRADRKAREDFRTGFRKIAASRLPAGIVFSRCLKPPRMSKRRLQRSGKRLRDRLIASSQWDIVPGPGYCRETENHMTRIGP